MAGLVPAIHDFSPHGPKDVDARQEAGHDVLGFSEAKSARADDGDEVVAGGAVAGARAARRNGAGDVVAVDFAERQRLGELARLAIGVGDGGAAFGARSETAV